MSGAPRGLGQRSGILHLGRRRIQTRHGDFALHFFRNLASGRSAMAIARGELASSAPLLARVHSSCVTSESLMGCDCDCAEQLDRALATIARSGRGVLFYLMQEGRGAGLSAKARDRMIVQASGNRVTTFEAFAAMGLPPDLRDYDEVAPMARLVGVRGPLLLLTNNPEKASRVATALVEEKIEVCGTEPIHGPTSDFNRDYLSAKHDWGHALEPPSLAPGARPPAAVRVFEPTAIPDDPESVVTASYFLPIALRDARRRVARGPSVAWFRASVVFDRRTEKEAIVLSSEGDGSRSGEQATTRASSVEMSLFDRLPVSSARGRETLARALGEIRDRGHGAVAVTFDDRDHAES